jgi:hypothetical protein
VVPTTNPKEPPVKKVTEKKKLPSTAPAKAFTAQVAAVVELEFPKELGEAADLTRTIQQLRLNAEREIDALKKKETALHEHVLGQLAAAKLDKASGKLATVSAIAEAIGTVEDWDALFAYIAKTKTWELIQKRLGLGAARERWEAGEKIPGVRRDTRLRLSITARG